MKKILLLLASFSLVACTSTIVRWPQKSPEASSRRIGVERKGNIFDDYLWTTPNIRSVRIGDSFTYNSHGYSFSESEDRIRVACGSESVSVELRESNKLYPDIASLKVVSVTKMRWVPKTKFVLERVAVQKTRTVPETTFDAKGMAHTSFRTEFYTDWEDRTVSRTDWEWESYSEPAFEIPTSQYYDVRNANGDHFIINRLRDGNAFTYLLQNPEYFVAREKRSPLGSDDVNMLFVDSQSNGIFFEEGDSMLFNIWNPYDKNSRYRPLTRIMDNYWYSVKFVEANYFMSFKNDGDVLSVLYENEEYLNSGGVGTLVLRNIGIPKTRVTINGKRYSIKSEASNAIQYGKYHITIGAPNRMEYDEYFEINDRSKAKVVDYVPQAPAARLVIKNVFSNDYKVFVTIGGDAKTYYAPKEVYLPVGTHAITIDVGGFKLERSVLVRDTTPLELDFEKEIKR